MSSKKHHNIQYQLIVIAIIVASLATTTYFVQDAFAVIHYGEEISGYTWQSSSETNEDTLTYLPLISSRFPPKSVYGVELVQISENSLGIELILQAGSKWSRSGEVAWMDVQPEEGMEPNWAALADSELQWVIAAEKGLKNIVVVDSTPDWARLVKDYSCGPIKEDKLDAFATFMYKLVRRYSQPPWNIKHWELWNEPDISHTSLLDPDNPYGCWGDEFDEYYGGGYYAEMLKRVYPAVKSADSAAKVLVGGLLLDCDPRVEGACGDNSLPPKFLRGILENDGKDFFDGVSFHSYDYFWYRLGTYGNPNWASVWNRTGPVILAKLDYITELLTEYNATDKSLYSTENALLWSCDDDPNTLPPECVYPETFQLTKAYYVAQTYAVANRAAKLNKLQNNNWWAINSWKESGLLEGTVPLPAYYAFSFSASQLQGADYLRDINEYPGVIGYKFRKNSNLVGIIWSLDGETHDIQLPNIPIAGYHVDGEVLDIGVLNGNSLRVTLEPVYIIWD